MRSSTGMYGYGHLIWLFVFPLCGFSLSLFCNYGYGHRREMELGGCLSSGSLPKAENWSGSAALQVVKVEEHVDVGPLLTAWSR